eukprot:gene16274-biopygen23259
MPTNPLWVSYCGPAPIRLEATNPLYGICLGLGPQLHGPETVERARRGVRNCTAAPTYTRLEATSHVLHVWGWGPSYISPKL